MRRFRIFHAWLTQVPDGTAAEDLPTLVGDHAISRLELDIPEFTTASVALLGDRGIRELEELVCRGRLWEEGLGPDDSLTFIEEVV